MVKKKFKIQRMPYETAKEYLDNAKGKSRNTVLSNSAVYELVTKADFFEGVFSKFVYSKADISAIIYNRYIDEFKGINPLLISNENSPISKEYSVFIAENLTFEQMQYIPKRALKNMDRDDIMLMMQRFSEVSEEPHYDIYEVVGSEINELLVTPKETIGKMLKKVLRIKKVRKSIDLSDEKYQNTGITAKEIRTYLNLDARLFATLYNNPDSPFFILNNGNNDGIKANCFELEVFKEIVAELYHPADKMYGAKTGDILPAEGIYKVSELIMMYGVNLTTAYVNRFIRLGELGYYEVTERNIRVSKFDFEDFLRRKISEKRFAERISNKRKIKNLDDYVVARDFVGMLYGNLSENFQIHNNIIYRLLNKKCEQFMDNNKVRYFKKSDLNEFFSSVYGIYTYGKDGSFENIAIDFDIDKCELYSLNVWVDKLHELYPSTNITTLTMYLHESINSGKLPVIKLSERVKLIRKDDLIKIDKLRNYLNR